MYIEASSPRVKGEAARLVSDRFKVSNGHNWCLKFWYHMYGNSVGSLKVIIKIYPISTRKAYYRTLWTQQLNHGDVWLMDYVQLNSPDNFEVCHWMTSRMLIICLPCPSLLAALVSLTCITYLFDVSLSHAVTGNNHVDRSLRLGLAVPDYLIDSCSLNSSKRMPQDYWIIMLFVQV